VQVTSRRRDKEGPNRAALINFFVRSIAAPAALAPPHPLLSRRDRGTWPFRPDSRREAGHRAELDINCD